MSATSKRLLIALIAAGCATAVLVALALVQPFPVWWEWLLFAGLFVYAEWRSVTLSDGLGMSSSVMVAFTAGVVFGVESAVLGVALIEGLAAPSHRDFTQRRFFEPLVNFGQLVFSAAAGVAVLSVLMPASVTPSGLWRVVVASVLGAAAYAAVNYGLVRWALRLLHGQRAPLPLRITAILGPFMAMGLLGGLLGATYRIVGPLALPVIVLVFLTALETVVAYGDLESAHEGTLRGFTKILEAKDLFSRGHVERVADLARMTGRRLGCGPQALDRLRWAALLQDVVKLAVPQELLRKRGRLDDMERARLRACTHLVERVLADVDFLEPIVGIVSDRRLRFDHIVAAGAQVSLEARVLAVTTAYDAMTSHRLYRRALSHEHAVGELKRRAGTDFDPAVVAALVSVVEESGRQPVPPAAPREAEAVRSGQESP